MITKVNNPVLNLNIPAVNGALFAANVDMGGNRVVGIDLVPATNDEAASKFYVDSIASTAGGGVFLPAGFGPIPWGGDSANPVPVGWLLCDGEQYDPAVYPNLFAAIGTIYNTGGETPGWFRVPDMRGRAPAGMDDMTSFGSVIGPGGVVSSASADVQGGSFGSETHVLTMSEMPSHDHGGGGAGSTDPAGAHSHGGGTGGGGSHTHDAGSLAGNSFGSSAGDGGSERLAVANSAASAEFAQQISGSTGSGGSSHSHTITSESNHTHTLNVSISSEGSDQAHNNMQPTRFFAWIMKADDSTVGFPGVLNMGGFNIVNAADPVAAQDVATKNYVDTFGSPTGAVIPFAGSSAPSAWLLCDGSAVSQTTYANLFALIGTTYNTGGEPAGTFRVPDIRGRVVAGFDTADSTGRMTGAVSAAALGNAGGDDTHILSVSEMPSHNHPGSSTANDGAHTHNVNPYELYDDLGNATDGPNTDNDANITTSVPSSGSQHTHALNIASQGGGNAHNNVQPTIVLNYIIKT